MPAQFSLHKLTPSEWVIVDDDVPRNDPRSPVACIYDNGRAEFDVIWLRDLGLGTRGFASPQEVLDASRSTASERPRSERPIPIAHSSPPGYGLIA